MLENTSLREIIASYRYFNSEAILLKRKSHKTEREAAFLSQIRGDSYDGQWEIKPHLISDSISYEGGSSYYIDTEDLYSLTFRSAVSDVLKAEENGLTLSAQFFGGEEKGVRIVVEIKREGESIDWRSMESNDYYQWNKWYSAYFVYPLCKDCQAEDELLVYIWNPDKSKIYVDNFRLANFSDYDYNYYQFD